jgi:hypothetical protein
VRITTHGKQRVFCNSELSRVLQGTGGAKRNSFKIGRAGIELGVFASGRREALEGSANFPNKKTGRSSPESPGRTDREIEEREKDFLRNGGTLGVPLPNFAAIDVHGFCANLPFSDVTGRLFSVRLGRVVRRNPLCFYPLFQRKVVPTALSLIASWRAL